MKLNMTVECEGSISKVAGSTAEAARGVGEGEAAKILGIGLRTLYRKLKEYGL